MGEIKKILIEMFKVLISTATQNIYHNIANEMNSDKQARTILFSYSSQIYYQY